MLYRDNVHTLKQGTKHMEAGHRHQFTQIYFVVIGNPRNYQIRVIKLTIGLSPLKPFFCICGAVNGECLQVKIIISYKHSVLFWTNLLLAKLMKGLIARQRGSQNHLIAEFQMERQVDVTCLEEIKMVVMDLQLHII